MHRARHCFAALDVLDHLRKGWAFAMDEARLKSREIDAEYFGHVLERIRAIRECGDEMGRRVRDALALAVKRITRPRTRGAATLA